MGNETKLILPNNHEKLYILLIEELLDLTCKSHYKIKLPNCLKNIGLKLERVKGDKKYQ